MGKYNAHIERFNVGEYSQSALTRVDLENTRLAAEIQENILPHIIGKGQVRPGTTYLGRTYRDQQARLVSFARSPSEKALLELTSGALRVWVDDALVTRNDVDCTIYNGDFNVDTSAIPSYDGELYNDDGEGWRLYGDGSVSFPGSGTLFINGVPRGGTSYAEYRGSTGSPGIEHGLHITIDKGPINFKIGSSPGGSDLFGESSLLTGEHSIAFTPNGTFYLTFTQRLQRNVEVGLIEIETDGPMVITAPWLTSMLRTFQFEQSADVIFCANRSLRPLMIQRRNTASTSWSLVDYAPLDGPFRDDIPGYGESKLDVFNLGIASSDALADRPVLNTNMEGSLVRVFHDRRENTFALAGENTWCDPFRVVGIKGAQQNDRKFDYSVSGTSSETQATVRFQRSVSGEGGDYQATTRDESTGETLYVISGTGSVSGTHLGHDEDANLVAFHRIGIGPGDYVSGTVSVSITYEGDSGYGLGFLRNVESDGVTTEVDWHEKPNAVGASSTWQVGAWSAAYEYPSGVALFDNRLWWGGSDRVWGSTNGNFFSFDDRDTTDLATITRRLGAGGQASQVNFLLPLQRLIAGTSGSEISIRSSSVGEVLTLLNTTIRTASTFGSSTVAPVRIDNRGIFVHRDGVTSMLLDYQAGAQDYATGKLTELNDEILLPSCVELGVQRQPETYVFHVRSDGQIAILFLQPGEGGNIETCWTRFITEGEVESIATLPDTDQDAVYMSVVRPTPTTAVLSETNADVLMGNASDGFAMDFSDGSVTVRSYDEASRYDYRGTGTGSDRGDSIKPLVRADYGLPPGPDRYFLNWGNYVGTQTWPVYTRQADGVLRLQHHNFMEQSEKFRVQTRTSEPFSTSDQASNPYITYRTPDDPFNGGNEFQSPSMQGEDNVATSPRGDVTAAKIWATSTGGASAQHMYMHVHVGSAKDNFDSGYPLETYYWANQETWQSLSIKAGEYDSMEFFVAARNSANVADWYDTNYPEVVGTGTTESASYIAYKCDATNGTISLVEETHQYTTKRAYITDSYVEDQGDGWYRFHFKTLLCQRGYYGWKLLNSAGDREFLGDDSSGLYVWGWNDKLDGTDDDYCYLKTDSEFSIFPDDPSLATVLLPYEWDANGNPLGVLCYDYERDDNGEQDQKWGAVSHYAASGAGDDTTEWTADLDGGVSSTSSSVLGPDGKTRAGIWTDNDAGVAASYCGMYYTRPTYTGYCNGSIYVKYTGSCRYFTISQVNFTPAPDEWYSTTYDLSTMTVTEEYTSAGGSLTATKTRIEPYVDGWYRISNVCDSTGFSGRVYFAMSTVPTPGAQTNGIDATTGTGNTVYVWYPCASATSSFNTAVPGPPRPRHRAAPSWGAAMYSIIPLGENTDRIYDYNPNRPEVPFDLDCYRLEQKVSIIDARTDADNFDDDSGLNDWNDGWPNEYISNVNQTNIGYIGNYVDDGTFDGFARKAGFAVAPNTEITALVQQAWSYQIDSIYFQGSADQALEFGVDTTLVVNQYKDILADTTVVDNEGTTRTGIPQTGVEFLKDSVQVGTALGTANFKAPADSDSGPTWWPLNQETDNRASYYLKQLKITSNCLPDRPRFIERLNKHSEAIGATVNKMGDAGGYFAGPVSSVQVEGLAGRSDIVGWGTLVSSGVRMPIAGLTSDGAGNIALGDTYTDVFVGIKYTARYKSGKLAYAASGGTSLEQPKKVTEFGVLLNDTHRDAVKYGEDFDRMRSMPLISRGKRVPDNTIYSEYDDVAFSFPGSWNTDSRVCLKVEAPYPATFTGLVISVEANARGGKS